jgi:cytochrome P450
VSKRADLGDLKVDFSFFFDNSEHGLTHRRVFSELFKVENITSHIPHIQEVARHQLSDLIEGQSGHFDFRKKYETHLKEIANKVLFGEQAELPRCSDEDKTSVTDMVFKILKELGSFKGIMHPLNLLFFGLPNKYNLLEASRVASKRSKMVSEAIVSSFKKRSTDQSYQLGVNILDLMVKSNRSNPDHQFLPKDIVGDTVLFLFAGSDSTSKTLTTCTYFLAKFPELAERIREDIAKFNLTRPGVSFEDLDKSENLDALLKEVLRTRSAGPASFDKLITKDFQLGKYEIKAGDKIVIPFCYHCCEKDYFASGNVFDYSNFIGEARKKYPQMAYIPFSSGKRSCLGRLLAEAIIKVSIVELLTRYDLYVPTDDKNSWTLGLGIDILHCNVQLTKRPSK